MKEVTYESTLYDYQDAIINDEFPGFKNDYLVLHSLIRKYKPKTFFEVGTCSGSGTAIICQAMHTIGNNSPYAGYQIPPGNGIEVYSLDLPTELSDAKERTGINCKFPYTQLIGSSLTFDFSKYPCEGYFIDGAHTYPHVNKETFEVSNYANLIIWHDSDINVVMDAILFTIDQDEFDLFRVTGTRIAYAIRK